jgi:hypothetical protein
LKCGSDPKQERRRAKGNDDIADLMYKLERKALYQSKSKQKKNPERPSNLPLRSWLTSIFRWIQSSRTTRRGRARTKTSQQKKKRSHTHTCFQPALFIDAEVIKTEKNNNVCLRNEMEIQSKTLDALLEKAEQVIRLLEVSDDTKCEPSHESEAVDQTAS